MGFSGPLNGKRQLKHDMEKLDWDYAGAYRAYTLIIRFS